jgi:mevalonate kinase
MLFGEHAVLQGRQALVGAVDQRLRVTVKPRPDETVVLSSALGAYQSTLPDLEPDARFAFLLEAVRQAGDLPSGMEVDVVSDFSATLGLGSSAAVTTATLAALAAWRGKPLDPPGLLHQAVHIIRTVQGTGSGADAAASVYGGVVAYEADPIQATPVDGAPPLSVIYSGYKTPTVEVIRRVKAAFADRPSELERVYDEIDALARAAADALGREDLIEAGELMTRSQACMVRLGVSDPVVDGIVEGLQKQKGITGAKISGSGLGDCVIGIGSTKARVEGYEKIETVLSPEGVRFE